MSTTHCVRCMREQEGLSDPPMGGEIGKKVQESVCAPCWKEWLSMSTKVINEYRLQLFRPEHRQILQEQMKLFLNLSSESAPGA